MPAPAPALPRFDAYIDGVTTAPASGQYFETSNPYPSAAWAEVARCGVSEADAVGLLPMPLAPAAHGRPLSASQRDTDEEAVESANDVAFGLMAGVWTQSINRALKVSKAIRAGTVWVNTYRAVSYLSPCGGYKLSGLDRENAIAAIRAYLQTKSVWISTAADVPNPFVMRI